MPTITQQQLNRFFQIIANSKLHSELTEAIALSDDNVRFGGNTGTNDALGYKPSVLRGFLGLYDASTNTPSLSNATGLQGDSYKVSVKGSFDFGAGVVKMAQGDVIEFREGLWVNKTKNTAFSEEYLGTVTTATNTTTNQEVEDFINLIGFTIPKKKIKLLKCNVYVDNILYTKIFVHVNNEEDIYGTGNIVVAYEDLIEIEFRRFDPTKEITTIVPLGDIGSSSIEDYINANDSISWDLEADVIYLFTATIDAVDFTYLYVGDQPKYLGVSQQSTVAEDFLDLEKQPKDNPIEIEIQDLIVITKNKTDLTVLENGDKFRYWDGDRYLVGKIVSVPITVPADLYDNSKVKLVIDNTIF